MNRIKAADEASFYLQPKYCWMATASRPTDRTIWAGPYWTFCLDNYVLIVRPMNRTHWTYFNENCSGLAYPSVNYWEPYSITTTPVIQTGVYTTCWPRRPVCHTWLTTVQYRFFYFLALGG